MKRTAFRSKARPREQAERVYRTPTVDVGRFRLPAPAANDIKARPKDEAQRCPHLLDLAVGMPCLLRVVGTCNRDPLTTVAAHSNWGIHSKGGRRKAHDYYSCWACSACHYWLDQGNTATKAEKQHAFRLGHMDQVLMWRSIAADTRRPPADRKAAKWALGLLNSTPTLDVTSFQLGTAP